VQNDQLVYAGIPIQELAEKSNFTEAAYLLLHKKLPTKAQLAEFNRKLITNRQLPAHVLKTIKGNPKQAHPMARLQSSLTQLGLYIDPKGDKMDQAIRLIAATPTLIAADYRVSQKLDPIPPRPDLSHTLNFLYMLGENPDSERTRYIAEVLDKVLLLHADHGFNASTHTVRTTASTMANLAQSLPGGIGALSGPRHGGANENVAKLLDKIQAEAQQEQKPFKQVMETWIKTNTNYPGVGHREYEKTDAREVILQKVGQEAKNKLGDPENWLGRLAIYSEVVDKHLEQTKGRKLVHNVDFMTGALFPLLNAATETKCLPLEMYTLLFALARVVGQSAHHYEQQDSGEPITRPIAEFDGPTNVVYTPIDQRP
jgi:citrate synthase